MTSIKILFPTEYYFEPRDAAEDPSAKTEEKEDDIVPDHIEVAKIAAEYQKKLDARFYFSPMCDGEMYQSYCYEDNVKISDVLEASILHKVQSVSVRFKPAGEYFSNEMDAHMAKIAKFTTFLTKIPNLSIRKINALIMLVVDMEWQYIGTGDCYLFGGFVRDLFDPKKEFLDIDIWGDHKDTDRAIRYELEALGYKTVSEVRLPKVAHYSLRPDHYRLTMLTPLGYEFSFDLTKGGSFHELGVDFTCNALYVNLGRDVLQVGVRVYFPEYPMIARECESFTRVTPSKECERYRLVHIPANKVLAHYKHQIDHESAIDMFFSLSDRYLENPANLKHSDFIGGLRALNRSVFRENIPNLEEILEEIEGHRAVRVAWCASLINDKRIATMKEKGYTIVEPSNSNDESCVSAAAKTD